MLALQVSGIVQYKSKQFSKSTDLWNVSTTKRVGIGSAHTLEMVLKNESLMRSNGENFFFCRFDDFSIYTSNIGFCMSILLTNFCFVFLQDKIIG